MYGLPTSWESSVATMKSSEGLDAAAWSPCSRFIAISRDSHPSVVEILDAMTLVELFSLEVPMGVTCPGIWLVFSPDGHLITWLGSGHDYLYSWIITWDLQTGVLVSSFSLEKKQGHISSSVTYSTCGTMFGTFLNDTGDSVIHTFNALSGIQVHSHPVKGKVSCDIWTHGECLRFATIGSKSVTIWEVGFDSKHIPTEVETLSLPDGFDSPHEFLPHPTLPQFALVSIQRICIWSTQHSKFLLDSADSCWNRPMSFSSDGHFFACGGYNVRSKCSEIHLWKEFDTGYVPHQRFTPNLYFLVPFISPNGGSVIGLGEKEILLWHTKDSSTSHSTAQDSERSNQNFIVGFSPDQTLAAVVQQDNDMITVLDLKSCIPWLTINTGIAIKGLGITGSSIIAVGDGVSGTGGFGTRSSNGLVVTWNLPTGDHIPNLRVDITNSVQTVVFSNGWNGFTEAASVSPDLHYIAIVGPIWDKGRSYTGLCLYDMLAKQCFGPIPVRKHEILWFPPDGCEVWYGRLLGEVDRWKITEDRGSGTTELEHLGSTTHQPAGPPWQSSCGHQHTDDRWICSSSGKQLLWLPPNWRSYLEFRKYRMWSGQFLALLHSELPEAVILELK